MCLDGEKNDRVAFQARADYQNHAIGWLHRGYSSLGGGESGTISTNLDGIWGMSVEPDFGGQRRTRVEEYYHAIDFADLRQVSRLLT